MVCTALRGLKFTVYLWISTVVVDMLELVVIRKKENKFEDSSIF